MPPYGMEGLVTISLHLQWVEPEAQSCVMTVGIGHSRPVVLVSNDGCLETGRGALL